MNQLANEAASYLDEHLELVDADTELRHGRLKHLPHPVVLHQFDEDGERLLLRHLRGHTGGGGTERTELQYNG